MLRQLKVRRHVATVLCLLSLAALSVGHAIRDRTAAAAPPALIASAAPRFQPGFVDYHRRPASEVPGVDYHRRPASEVPGVDYHRRPASEVPGENARHGFDWSRVRRDASGYVDVRTDGSRAELTLDPALQAR